MIARRAATVLIAGALAFGLSACTLGADIATLRPYAPSDGVQTNVGDIKVRNAFAYSEDGVNASLIMSVFNTGDEPADVKFQFENGLGEKVDATISIDANSSVSVGNDGEQQLVLENLNEKLGSLVPVYVQYGSEAGEQILVPLLSTDSLEYEGLLPTPAPSQTPTPSASPLEEEG